MTRVVRLVIEDEAGVPIAGGAVAVPDDVVLVRDALLETIRPIAEHLFIFLNQQGSADG